MNNENEITINGVVYIAKSEINKVQLEVNTDGLQFVCIRTYSAGVHCGYLAEREGKEVKLLNARRIWKWAGAFTLSELATIGTTNPENCKFACTVPEIILTEAIEIIPMTEKAKETIDKVDAYDVTNN